MADAIEVTGLSELSRDLKRVSDQLPKDLKAVGKDAASLVSETAKGIAPVKTGKLQKKIRPGATAKGAYVSLNGLVYGKVIHFGWPRHNIAPQPVLYEALDSRRDEVVQRFQEGVEKLIDRTIQSVT